MTILEILIQRFTTIASVSENDDLNSIAGKVILHGAGAVVVLDSALRLVGIITEGDVVKALANKREQFFTLKARDLMNPEVFTCRPDDTELEILTAMTERNIRHMAIMVEERVAGLVTLEEAVRQRLNKVSQFTEQLAQEPHPALRDAMLDGHLTSSWDVFSVHRAWIALQQEFGLADLDSRSQQMLWVIGDADRGGEPIQLRDLMKGHRWGTYPTIRRAINELLNAGLIAYTLGTDGRSRRFRLSERGKSLFSKVTHFAAARPDGSSPPKTGGRAPLEA